MKIIKLGTRKSPLALAQSGQVATRLEARWPELKVELVPLVTSGDKFTDKPLADAGGKGLFTKEIEEALLEGAIDFAVHSMKDMPTVLPAGLIISAMPEREDARDWLVGKGLTGFADLPEGATFGTASLRRAAQVLLKRPDVKIVPLRGNVGTRLAKIESGEMHATMLAAAGLKRLGLADVPGAALSIAECLPAVAQGILGLECREGDEAMGALLAPLSHADTELAATCERTFLKMLDGSCRTPIAGYAEVADGKIHFRGMLAREDGSQCREVEIRGNANDAAALGEQAGRELLGKKG